MAESVKISQGHLECSICCTRYNQPKNLDCSHSYCLKCLQELKKTQNPDTNKLKCPLCQKQTILPIGGVTGLQNNYLLIAMVEEVNIQEQLPQGEQSKVMCQACDEENAAISRCLNCEHYLCQECQKAHRRSPALKKHEIQRLAELKEDDKTKTESKMNISRCDIHPIQELCLYCMTCEQLTCKLCAEFRHKQPMHNLADLLTAFDICQTEAIKDVSQLHKNNVNMAGQLAAMRTRLTYLFHETNDHISCYTEQKIDKIRREEIKLKQNAKLMYQSKNKKLDKLQLADQTMNMISTHSKMTDVNRLEILKNRQEIIRRFKNVDVNVEEDQEEDETYDLSFIAFCEVENEVELGTLLHTEKWELMSSVEIDAQCLSSYSTGDIIAVGCSKIKILRQIGKNFKIISQVNCKDISTPTAIAVNNEDHLIVLDFPHVKTFNKEFQLLHRFHPDMGSGHKLTCLAVDENNLIAVGLAFIHGSPYCKGAVSLHNPGGSIIRTLSAPGEVYNVIMINQRIIYTYNQKLRCVDFHGNNIKEQELSHAVKGLCCDKTGDIYLLDSFGKIQHLSAMGTPGKRILRDKGGHSCGPITFTQNGKIAVKQSSTTVHIYHRL